MRYLGQIPFREALRHEHEAWLRVRAGSAGETFAFETEPVITLGKRATTEDILNAEGFEVMTVERGGQATLHNPGQLVIFPIYDIRTWGARAWVDFLLRVGIRTLKELGVDASCRSGSPGLFTPRGKIAAIGLRVKDGISTHGISLNVTNDLADFNRIRACGVLQAAVDRVGTASPREVFAKWERIFNDGLTSSSDLTTLGCSSLDVRL